MNIDDFMDAEIDWLSRRESAVLNDFLDVYQSTLLEINERLADIPGHSFTYRHLSVMERQLDRIITGLHEKQKDRLSNHAKETYAQSLEQTRNNWVGMETAFGSEEIAGRFSLIQPKIPQTAIEELIASAGPPISRISDMTASKIRRSLSQSLIMGEGIKEAAKRLEGLNFDLEKRRLQLIARMETSRANNSARQQTVEELNRRNPGIEFWEIYRDRVDHSSKTRNHWFSWAVNNTVRNVTLKEFFEVAVSDMLRSQQQWSNTTKRKASFSGIIWVEVNGVRRGRSAPAHYNDRAVILPWRPTWRSKLKEAIKHPQSPISLDSFDNNQAAPKNKYVHVKGKRTPENAKEMPQKLYGLSDEAKNINQKIAQVRIDSSKRKKRGLTTVFNDEKIRRLTIAKEKVVAEIYSNIFSATPEFINVNKKIAGTGVAHADVDNGVKFYSKLFDKGSFDGLQPPSISKADGPRGFYRRVDNKILLGQVEAAEKTTVHELSHWIEATKPEVLDKSIQFREKRTKNLKPEILPNKTILKDKYGRVTHEIDEYGVKDGFPNAYYGKAYYSNKRPKSYPSSLPFGENDAIRSTEVLTMGIELMHRDVLYLLQKDRKYFEFIWEVITGA